MIYIQIFLAFFYPGILGYGGGPATIPLIEHEVVENYGWMTTSEFSEVLALGNSLPGPIATKMAGFIGYEVGGVLGVVVALFATVAPSLILMLILLNILYRFRNSPRVKRLSSFVLPAIAVLLAEMTFDFVKTSYDVIGLVITAVIVVCAYFALEKLKIHPAFVILAGLVVGGVFL
ncbi:transporter [Ureibacillus massiliensis 4400831 = CIP 108448 = CCUG 49529]|uniref:Transporter n=1 Tax=Ureibacillus massiliensis 4400831 = CIP 108448 = CCUG 49529 TaxID=1211035 RepID=A0A0A3J315_9BACL|nr:chromate transporter [Ureibacillus massiliensis]KGR91281.1 transporter [Ureibacillus massiliensis 4400831 = CIP 108448 = CCUG 49529]